MEFDDDGYGRSLIAFAAGFLIGPVIGGLLGHLLFDGRGAVLGAFGGLVVVPQLLGGTAGLLPGTAKWLRSDAGPLLAFGVLSTVGAALGTWLGSAGIAHLSPGLGYFLGLGIPGYPAARLVGWLMDGDTDELLLPALGTAGAGGGAALASSAPGWGPTQLAVTMAIGTVVGVLAAVMVNAVIADSREHRYR